MKVYREHCADAAAKGKAPFTGQICKIEQTESAGGVINFGGSMDYSYTLRCYDEDGNAKDITFGTSRELKEDAFIRLTVMPIRGVLEWAEVQYDELPVAVQEEYSTPQ